MLSNVVPCYLVFFKLGQVKLSQVAQFPLAHRTYTYMHAHIANLPSIQTASSHIGMRVGPEGVKVFEAESCVYFRLQTIKLNFSLYQFQLVSSRE